MTVSVSPPLIDTHVHLWDLDHPTLRWSWLDTPQDHPILGDIDSIKSRAYVMRDLEAESRFAGISGYVHVQAAIGSPDPVAETRWLTDMAAAYPLLRAIIGHVDLGLATTDAVLDAHQQSALFRGVRDFGVEPYLASGVQDAAMERSLASLARRGLVLDMDCEHPNMAAAADLARRHPDLTIVLEHIGFPRRRDAAYFAAWRAGIDSLAQAPNVICKISGVGMTDPRFTADSLRPWVLHCLDAFGPGRAMLGSNWPLDRLCSSYDVIMGLYRSYLADLAADEQAAVLSHNAATVYGL